jgi:excisionase family DNA binding protein
MIGTSVRNVATQRRLLRVKEAAKMLGVSTRKVYMMVWSGELRHVRLGRLCMVELAEVEAWIDRNTERCGR